MKFRLFEKVGVDPIINKKFSNFLFERQIIKAIKPSLHKTTYHTVLIIFIFGSKLGSGFQEAQTKTTQ